MEDELSLENILNQTDIDNLFVDDDTPLEDNDSQEEDTTQNDNKNKQKQNITEVNPDELFGGSESVGDEKDNEEQEEPTPKGQGTSPKNFYSSIAKALKEEGIFPDLDDENVNKIKAPEDFRDVIEQQIKASLDERQKRIDEALNAGIETSDIKKFEDAISYLDSIGEESLSDESDKGENLRKQLIYQDFINRGYSKERATREVQKSLNAGTDIEDAREALKGNKDYFNEQYNNLIADAKKEEEVVIQKRKEQGEALKKSILEDKKVFGEIELDKATRQKIYENIASASYKDPDTGRLLTPIQKYEKENSTEFLKKLGLVFTLTNGFKDFNGLLKGKIRKEVNKGLRELENTLNNTSRDSDGNLRFMSGVSEDSESSIHKGWNLDI